ncbi:MAG: ABC transporter permease [Spirochaetes bacterium]|nr:ABC transporter permease [Spirochaetota bacterium]
MNLKRVWHIFIKDLAVGPRSPLLVFMVVMPLVMTLALNLVFGNLSSSEPKLALYVEAESAVQAELERLPGLRLTIVSSADELRTKVEAHDFDAGLVIPTGFDADLREGRRPLLQLYFSGESYAMDRVVLVVNTLDVLRSVEGRTPPVDVELLQLEEGDPIPLSVRFIPVLVLFAFVIAGLYTPASLLVEEKERKTLVAMLTTPANLSEVVMAKGFLGVVLAFALAAVTLLINQVVIVDVPALLVAMLVSAIFWSVLGVLVGLVARTSEMLFAIVKGTGTLLMGPVIFYIFPDWPQWIARFFPTFWAIDPLWQLVANDATLADIVLPLAITLALSVLMLPFIAGLGRRVLRQMA